MSLPIPKVGDVNIRGYVLPRPRGAEIEALQSLYGNQPPNGTNALLFDKAPGEILPDDLTEIYFDIVPEPAHFGISFNTRGYAANIRRA